MEAQQHQQGLRFLPPFALPPIQCHRCSQLPSLMAPKWLPLLWGHLHTQQHPAAEKGMFSYRFVFIRTLSCLSLATHPTFPQVSMPDFIAWSYLIQSLARWAGLNVWFRAIRIYPWIGDLYLGPMEEPWSLEQSGGSISKEGRVAVG